jgi:hypothetical protein
MIMSDYTNYNDNLAFPPKPIGSQDELPEIGRQSEVLLATIDECQKLKRENQKLQEVLKRVKTFLYYNVALKCLNEVEDIEDLIGY